SYRPCKPSVDNIDNIDSKISRGHKNELLKFSSALKEWGCFQVVNNGMTNVYLDELVKITRQFFDLSLEEKLKCSMADDFFNGYGNAAAVAGDTKSVNWNDRLFLTVYPEDQRKLQLWPENPLRFREILHDFSLRLKMMLDGFLKAMAQSLDLEENSFSNQHGEGSSISTRFGLYPRCACPDRVYGVHPHSDRSTVTILLQDNDVADGLHVQKDGQWYKVPVIPGAFFVNIGDFAEVMSNGIFKSAVHRVVTNSEKERVSVAAFCAPDPENEVEPIPQLITTNQPKMYNKVNMATYKQLFFETYPHGKRVLDALRI
ncbi:hypothetical protein KSS87_019656, partial [Heliosperma pusillum]